MLKLIRFLVPLLALGLLAVSCSHDENIVVPADNTTAGRPDKNGTETLGPPSINIADGSCFAQGGVGMVGMDTGTLEIEVPDAEILQVLLYWSGGTTSDSGDDMIKIDGMDVTGTEIGGPTLFFSTGGAEYNFYTYRADITAMDLVTPNMTNSFEISDFNFDFSAGPLDENHGAGMMVIYDDGTEAALELRDGLDCAYHGFAGDLQVTVPQTFTFGASTVDRYAKMVIFSGSVGVDRPNEIHISTEASPRINQLYSADELLWDTLCLEDVYIPAGATEVTVELVSPSDTELDGASMTWIGCGFALPEPTYCIGDFVWYDENGNGCQDEGEMGVEGVEVNLWTGCPPEMVLLTTYTDAMGSYQFCELLPGDYTVQFVAPGDYYFCHPFSEECNTAFDSNAGEDGITDCVTILDADDMTIDAALCLPVPAEACRVTGGCRDTYVTDAGTEVYSCGGQAGAPTADQPQPWGEWTHTQRRGPSGSFTFHAGTASAPPGTEIDWIECMDPGWCVQARWAPAKQIDFAGVGTFKNMGHNVPASISDYVTLQESLHWFEVNVDDLGEPGRAGTVDPPAETCDPLGFGLNSDTQDADCECPDFYRIRIYTGPDDSYDIMYEVYGYIDRGNFQIHPEIH